MKKKLIEVALPLEAINIACKADKDRKTGSIRNIHKWFAPMPVPALRALTLAALLDDPGTEEGRENLMALISTLVASVVEAPDHRALERARDLINDTFAGSPPLVLDPFCGGGSTLVEAQRLGLRSVGGDLNPVPVLISKVLVELAPKVRGHPSLHSDGRLSHGDDPFDGLRTDVKHYAQRMRSAAWDRLGPSYPTAPDGSTVAAWLWARTVPSPDPRLEGALTPLVSNWWLSKKRGAAAFVAPVVDVGQRKVDFEVKRSGEPDPPAKGRCLYSGAPIDFAYVRNQGMQGKLGLQMYAVVAQNDKERSYFPPDAAQLTAAEAVRPHEPPGEELPDRALSFGVQAYGLRHWSELFTSRQLLMLETFASLVREVGDWVRADGGSDEYAIVITAVLGLCIGKLAQFSTQLCVWYTRERTVGKVERAFAGHDVSLKWDFPEANPFGNSVGDWTGIVDTTLRALSFLDMTGPPGVVVQSDARKLGARYAGEVLVIADPPYFSAIGYADVSDFFYLWLRKALASTFPELFGTLKTPKADELIASPFRQGSRAEAARYFIEGFTETFAALRHASRADVPLVVIYAQREQERGENGRFSTGWEAILEAMLESGLMLTGTWPIRGTGSSRMIKSVGGGTSSLATYVALVCRPRAADAPTVARREFLFQLRAELTTAIRQLQAAGIPPVDLHQAAIGPGMGVFSSHNGVVEADGSSMPVRSALQVINQVVDEVLEPRGRLRRRDAVCNGVVCDSWPESR